MRPTRNCLNWLANKVIDFKFSFNQNYHFPRILDNAERYWRTRNITTRKAAGGCGTWHQTTWIFTTQKITQIMTVNNMDISKVVMAMFIRSFLKASSSSKLSKALSTKTFLANIRGSCNSLARIGLNSILKENSILFFQWFKTQISFRLYQELSLELSQPPSLRGPLCSGTPS